MKLQVAIDLLTADAALELAGKVADYVDILGLGAPLIKSEGLPVVSAVKKAHPDKLVLADLQTMDAGELEANLAFAAGADLVTVLGVADDSTIAGAITAAAECDKGVIVDLIGVADKVGRANEVRALGAKYAGMHAGLDEQAQPGFDLARLLRMGKESGVPFSVAGGVKLTTITDIQQAGADVAVVGSSIYGAADPAQAARKLRGAVMWLPVPRT
jgi:3-hexulose-6-phosphate synthase